MSVNAPHNSGWMDVGYPKVCWRDENAEKQSRNIVLAMSQPTTRQHKLEATNDFSKHFRSVTMER